MKQLSISSNKKIVIAVMLLSLLSSSIALSVETYLNDTISEDIEQSNNNNIQPNDKSKNANIDMKIVYGYQYNNVLSTINLSQEGEDFVYLLSSHFKRSNDFGYNGRKYTNSSFNENRIGFTGNSNILERMKLTFDAVVDSDSRGMFNNPVYSREEKDKFELSIKNIYEYSTSSEWYLSLGGAGYVHRLKAIEFDDRKSKLNQFNFDTGSEYIWSAHNRIRFGIGGFLYNYSVRYIDNDRYLDFEIIDDINVSSNFGISIGLGYDWNKDEDPLLFPFPIIGFSLKGYKHISSFILYRYDIVPFKPEEFYLGQKYIKPSYDLPPGRVHHGDIRLEYRMNSRLNLKGNLEIEKNNNFYNYATVNGNVLSADTISVIHYNTRIDTNLILYKKILELAFGFEYSYFDADKNITYIANRKFSNTIKYNGKKWKLEWTNKYIGRVDTDPDEDNKLEEAMIGYFGIQRQVHDGFYAYARIENLYNNKYNLREDYPEPGFQLLGGLRILI
ncbi:MAG: hypothetical protein SVZ03_06505 [Spirochaetota bacterium]|nr:hypothetical protein [Spirochaetota bacterium]